jgi:O-antigen/teichoic acid export membrane protein
LVIGATLTLALVASAKFLITLLGPRFSGSLEILYILSTILFFQALIYGISTILVATQHQGQVALINIIGVIFNIVVDLLIIQRANIQGVAIVYVITEILLMIGFLGLILRYLPDFWGSRIHSIMKLFKRSEV